MPSTIPQDQSAATTRALVERYGVPQAEVRWAWAPYRICPLGAHIDHQLGPVTAMALDRGVLLAYAASDSASLRVSSLDFAGEVSFSWTSIPDRQPGDWGNFPRGAVRALLPDHVLRRGLVGVTSGRYDGGGLSSSAAVGVAFLLALEDVNNLHVSRQQNIAYHQAIENDYLGMRIGVLDQSAILLSRRDQLTWVDTATYQYECISYPQTPLPFRILIVSSGLKQALVSTDYNRRVEECQEAARCLLAAAGAAVDPPLLGRVSEEQYLSGQRLLHGSLARRAAHFFAESARVRQGVVAWRDGQLERFGELVTASGESSIQNYECGCPPLIDLYHLLCQTPGVLGARFSGAGFRGCCLALVRHEAAREAAAAVFARYTRLYPDLQQQAHVMVCDTDDGARILAPDQLTTDN